MKKVLYTDFVGIDETIGKMLSDKDFKKAITRSNLYTFWANVVGEKFAKKSRPFSMSTNNTMIIACANATVAQELLFRKNKILKELEPFVKSLKIKVNDLKFDPKRWIAEEDES